MVCDAARVDEFALLLDGEAAREAAVEGEAGDVVLARVREGAEAALELLLARDGVAAVAAAARGRAPYGAAPVAGAKMRGGFSAKPGPFPIYIPYNSPAIRRTAAPARA